MRMQTAALIAGMSIALASPLAAQRVEYGPRLGVAFSTVSVQSSGPDNTEENNVAGVVAGGFVRFRPGRLGVQAELTFVRKGAFVVTPGTEELDLRLGYLEIPVLLVAPIGSPSTTSANVYGGPALAIETGCAGTFTDPAGSVNFDCNDAAFDVFDRRQIDVGAMLGADVSFALGRGRLLADARYTMGFVNLNKESGDKIRNRSVAVSLGYSFVAGK